MALAINRSPSPPEKKSNKGAISRKLLCLPVDLQPTDLIRGEGRDPCLEPFRPFNQLQQAQRLLGPCYGAMDPGLRREAGGRRMKDLFRSFFVTPTTILM